jgi:hypothetical protein
LKLTTALYPSIRIASFLLLPPCNLFLTDDDDVLPSPPTAKEFLAGPKDVYFPPLFLFLDIFPSAQLYYPPVRLGTAPQDM